MSADPELAVSQKGIWGKAFAIIVIAGVLALLLRTGEPPLASLATEIKTAVRAYIPKGADPRLADELVDKVFADAHVTGADEKEFRSLAESFLDSLEEGFDHELALGLMDRVEDVVYGDEILDEYTDKFEKFVYDAVEDGEITAKEVQKGLETAKQVLLTVQVVPSG
jgi:hypothetical protein